MSHGETPTLQMVSSHDGGAEPPNGGAAVPSPNAQKSPSGPAQTESSAPPQVQEVLSSEIGVASMLSQLKASIASAKEFALFLKKRSSAEESHASSLKKLARISNETMHLPEHKTGTFAQAYTEMMYVHERMAENGMQFALSLHTMHDDLVELAAVAERSRKGWKVNGLAPEQKVAELETILKKAKVKYDSLAEDYDRVRTGDTSRQHGKMFSLKNRTGPQHEEELLRKVQAADQDYQNKVQHWQSEKAELVSRTRPEAIKALQELVRETDSGVALQMQKFASFNEKLLLSNGLSISPMKGEGQQAGARSLREAMMAIDNEKDLNDFVASCYNRLPQDKPEIKYEKHPVLSGPQQSGMGQPSNMPPPQSQMSPQGQFPVQTMGQGQPQSGPQSPAGPPGNYQSMGGSLPQGQFGQNFSQDSMPPPGMASGGPQSASSPHSRSFSQGNPLQSAPPSQQYQPSRNSAMPTSRFNDSASPGPPQLGALPFQGSSQSPATQSPQQQQQPPWQQPGPDPMQHPSGGHPGLPSAPNQGRGGSPQNNQPAGASSMPTRPVFGLPLNRLYERDGLAVPMIVYQCIQAVDLFGLGVEGIYRQSGSVNHINKLKQMFDTDSSNPALDFRNPENFFHDVNSVTGLLKQFLRDLSDPLLTSEAHSAFVEAAKHDDDIVRRDSLHAIINNLPDPNYATLRALTLHLSRVMDNSHQNRMNCHNLAVIFGPTLMGTDPSTAIADAGWQIKAIDTILQNTLQIFDED